MTLKFQPFQTSSDVDAPFWAQLKDAIATTSGFHRWALEKGLDPKVQGRALDSLVHSYLRQTLETLAY